MILYPFPRGVCLLQHVFFVVCLAVPAYFAASTALTPRAAGLAWYHRVGLAILCLLSAWVVMVLPGLLVVTASWIVRHIRRWPGERALHEAAKGNPSSEKPS